jgi:hypothetical protein
VVAVEGRCVGMATEQGTEVQLERLHGSSTREKSDTNYLRLPRVSHQRFEHGEAAARHRERQAQTHVDQN